MNDESTSSNGGNLNDDNGAEADNMEETDNQRNESKRNSIRIKAKERVEDADNLCLMDRLMVNSFCFWYGNKVLRGPNNHQLSYPGN